MSRQPDRGLVLMPDVAGDTLTSRLAALAPRLVRPTWLVLSVLGALGVVAILANPPSSHGVDALAYWSVDPRDPYVDIRDDSLGGTGAFRYAPIVALALGLFHLLPWPVFLNLWLVAQVAALVAIGRRWALALVLFPPVFFDLAWGNINIFLALAVVASFRWPAAWCVPLLTKVTPGVGIGWYVGRRDWRSLLVVVAILGGALVVSLPFVGFGPWAAWLDVLGGSVGDVGYRALDVPLLVRVPVAFGLAVFAGATDRRWLIPIAVTLAMPVLWTIAYTPLIALVAISRVGRTVNQASATRRGSVEPAAP